MSRVARAAVYDAPNAPFLIREYPLRTAEPGEVLVRVAMSTICRSDIHSYEGRRPNPTPCILGHEIIGVIEELGAAVGRDLRGDRLAVGDRVTWTEYFVAGSSVYRDVLDMPQKSRYTVAGFVNPNADVTMDASVLVRQCVTLRGIHNYHPRHLVQALAFVVANRGRFPFADIVDARFSLRELGEAFRKATERSVLRAAIIP